MQLGINLATIRSYLPCPFLDITLGGSGFIPQTTGKGTVLPNGWPAGDTTDEMAGMFYFPATKANYTIIVTKGAASQVRIIKTSTRTTMVDGRATFDMPGDGKAMQVNIKPVAGAGETRVAIVRTDLLGLWQNGEIFDPEWLASFAGFKSFRAMDWMQTNGSLVTDSFVPADASFLGRVGAPVELVVALANKTGMRPHICVPAHASDSWVKALFGKLAKLRPGIIPTIEYANEVWNGDFEAHTFAVAQSTSLWSDTTSRGYQWHGFRSGQIAVMARGTGFRIGIGCQTAQPGMSDKVWAGVKLSGATDADFSDWLIAAYVNGDLTGNVANTLVLATAGSIDGGIDNILHTGAGSVDAQAKVYLQHKAVADAHGLKLTVYEGNIHVNALPKFGGVSLATVLPYFKALCASAGAAKVMTANLLALQAAGVDTVNLFNDRQNWTEWGCFGLYGTPAWDAAKLWISEHGTSDIAGLLGEIDAFAAELADLRDRVAALVSA